MDDAMQGIWRSWEDHFQSFLLRQISDLVVCVLADCVYTVTLHSTQDDRIGTVYLAVSAMMYYTQTSSLKS
jgi:hypothetical protein